MEKLFKGSTALAHWNEGDYQGTVATAVMLADGRFVYYSDGYGSCSGCDAWEDADDSQVRRNCEDIVDGVKVFDTLEAMLTALDNEHEQFANELSSIIRTPKTPN